MTIEDAIRRIKDFGLHHAIKDLPYSILTVEAFEMAIRSLEAWKEVKEEMINLQIVSSELTETGYNSLCRHFEVLQIIDKHTKEITT